MRLVLILMFCFCVARVDASTPPPLYGLEMQADRLAKAKPAFMEAKKGNWSTALNLIKNADSLSQIALKWYYFVSPDTKPDFADYQTFLLSHKNWPDQDKMLIKAEAALCREANLKKAEVILKWFSHFAPVTTDAKRLLLEVTPDATLKNNLIQELWSSANFTSRDEESFLKKYKSKISLQAHLNRARMYMDQGKFVQLKGMMPYLPAAARTLYTIRQQILRENDSIAGLIKAVPRAYADDPGLLMQCLKWFHKRDMHDEAQVILLEYKPLPEYQEEWENIRRTQSREVMKTKRYMAAHDIAMRHSFADGERAAEMEWFAGWIMLEYLHEPAIALKHFANVLKIVKTNLSLSRAFYWLGRTYAKLNDKKQADAFLHRAAQFGWTFYGQVAAADLGVQPNLTPIKPQPIPDSKAEFIKVAHIMATIDEMKIARQFLQAANKLLDIGGQHLTLSHFARKLGIAENIVRFAREAQNKSVGIAHEAYPMLNIVFQTPLVKQGLDPALVHAIILQESRFDEKVIAFDGGMGYMQFMEPTAKRIAKLAKVPFSKKRLLEGKYNILLGTTYLKDLLRIHDGCYPFIIPAYNAGDEPVKRWRAEFGDPLTEGVDILNWMESITYVVTRSYIHRVSENLFVYRHLLKTSIPNANPWWRVWNVKKRGKAR